MKKYMAICIAVLLVLCTGTYAAAEVNFLEYITNETPNGDGASQICRVFLFLEENGFFHTKEGKSVTDETDKALRLAAEEKDPAALAAGYAAWRSVLLANYGASSFFEDVKETDWFYSAVTYCRQTGLFKGTSDVTFSPAGEMTRAMFVTVAGRMCIEETTGYKTRFRDVENGAYYENYVTWADTYGILDFWEGETFSPNKPITREEMAAVLYGCAKYNGFSAESGVPAFSDADAISAFAKEAVYWCEKNKIINGFEDGTFRPAGVLTRAETAQVIANFNQ